MTVDGAPAPRGTLVRVALDDGGLFGETRTGAGDLRPDEYRFVTESSRTLEGRTVLVSLPQMDHGSPAKVRFRSDVVLRVDLEGWTVAPTPTPMPSPGVAIVNVPPSAALGPNGTGVDANGEPVESPGGRIQVGAVGGSISLPITVTLGASLARFEDPDTGITVAKVDEGRMLVRIPVRDREGNDQIRILVTTGDLVGTGSTVEGPVEMLGIDLPTKSVDLTEEDPRVGVASVKVVADVARVPWASFLKMSIVKDPGVEVRERVAGAAREVELEIIAIAFAVDFEKRNLDEALEEVTLTLKLGRAWVSRHGAESIRAFRAADDGTTELLEAMPIDLSADPVAYKVVSPGGLSGFGIAAVRQALRATPPAVAVSPTTVAAPTPGAPPVPTPALPPTPVPTRTPGPIEPGPSPPPPVGPSSQAVPTPTPSTGGGGCSRPAADGSTPLDAGLLLAVTSVVGYSLARRRWG